MMTIMVNQLVQGCLPYKLLSLNTQTGIITHQQKYGLLNYCE